MWLSVLLTVLTGYLLGNLNGAVSMSRLLDNKDIREQGSGNAGLTNFMRAYSPAKAILVVLIDMGKAFLACSLGRQLLAPFGYAQEGVLIGGIAVNLGHDFPALLGFRGGKGVLCGITVAFAADWRCGLVAIGVFALVLFLTRYVSLSSILGCLSFAILYPLLNKGSLALMIMGTALALFIVFMHRSNIARLLKGNERKATFSKFRKKK